MLDDYASNQNDFGFEFERCCPRSATIKLIDALRAAHPEAETCGFAVRPEPVPVEIKPAAPPKAENTAELVMTFHKLVLALPMQQIIHDVAHETGISREDLLSKRRHRPIVRARWIAMHRMRSLGYSYPAIGRVLGGKDHSTIINGVRNQARMQLQQQEAS